MTDEFGNAFPSGQVEHMAVDAGTYTPIVTGADITNVHHRPRERGQPPTTA